MTTTADPGTRAFPAALLDQLSVEITARDVDGLREAAPLLPPGTPVSITFLPGETQDARVAAAALARRLGFVPVPHISARRLGSREELDGYLGALARHAGLDRAFVVAGDCAPKGPFSDALDVIRSGQLAAHGVRRVGISGYPGGHPDIPTDMLWRAMEDKHRCLRELGHDVIITTQFAFDARSMIDWAGQVRDRGISSTIRLGVPGPATIKSLLRFAARCGVGASTTVLRKYGISMTRLMSVAGPDRLLDDLATELDGGAHGDVRIHLYPFGGLPRATEWVRAYRAESRHADTTAA